VPGSSMSTTESGRWYWLRQSTPKC
jgi:hypothetical protein